MNPSKFPHSFRTKQSVSFQSFLANKSTMLLKQPMIETPERDRRFDPNELMTIDLIKTPRNTESLLVSSIAMLKDYSNLQFQASSVSSSDPSAPSMIAKLSVRNRMVCHEDFPRLLALLNRVKKANTTTNSPIKQSADDESQVIASLMKEKLGINILTISRGQCPLTDRMMQGYYTMLQCHLKAKTKATTEADSKMHSVIPTRLFSSRTQFYASHASTTMRPLRNGELKTSNLISWAEDFPKTSPLIDCKSPVLSKREKSFQKKMTKDKKTKHNDDKNHCEKHRNKAPFLNNGATSMSAHTKMTHEKKRCAEKSFDSSSLENKKRRATSSRTVQVSSNLKLLEDSLVNQSLAQPKRELANPFVYNVFSSYSPMKTIATIASDIAIAMTPRPFKNLKTACLLPSEVTTKFAEPLSDITSRSTQSSIASGRNILGVSVVIPRVSLFPDDTRIASSPDAIVSSLKIKHSNRDDKKRSISTAKENRDSFIEKPFLKTIDEAGTPTNGESTESFRSKNTDTVKTCIKTDSGFTDSKSPHLLSISFL